MSSNIASSWGSSSSETEPNIMSNNVEILSESPSDGEEMIVPNKKRKISSEQLVNYNVTKDIENSKTSRPSSDERLQNCMPKEKEANNSSAAGSKKKGSDKNKADVLSKKQEKLISLQKQKQFENNLKKVIKSTTDKEECIKNIIVLIDHNIMEQEYGDVIKDILRESKISTKSTTTHPNVITWARKLQTLENMCLKESEQYEKHALTIISAKKFSNLVSENHFRGHIEEKMAEVHCEHLTIAIFGMNKPTEKQELVILEVELFIKCHFEFVRNVDTLAEFVLMMTKSVALIPYKLANEEKYKSQNIYFNEFKKDSVKVDQNGNGLGRLWHQMLTMFPLARLETAEAITTAYPTPSALFRGYETCTETETMLQHLDVRRAHGPLASNRRIGPEMSKKCFNYFTAVNEKCL